MIASLRVLFVEDSEDDVLLLTRQLHAAGYLVAHEQVNNADAFRSAMHRGGWDIIIADYALQRFHSSEALSTTLQIAPDIPFIVISGVMGEEVALECIHAGAADYVTKQNAVRLVPVVARAIRDAAERRTMRRAEADLRGQRSLLSMIYDNTSDSMALYAWDVTTGAWRLLFMNRATLAQFTLTGIPVAERDLLGRTWEEVVGRTITPFADPEPLITAFYRTAETGRMSSLEQHLLVHGKAWHYDRTFVLFFGPDGQTRYVLWVSREVTARKQAEAARRELEQQRAEAEKMQALGQLAGGVAHDFNNILTSILGFSDVIQQCTTDEGIRLQAGEIVRGARRAKELVRQILMFSRKKSTERKPVSIVGVVEEAVQLLRGSLPANVQLSTRVPNRLPSVLGDATQLHQVVMNLVTNSVQAIGPQRGHIEVAIAVVGQHENNGESLGECVRLVVTDNGPGMSQAVLDRLFEPFFTTKAPGDGSGLGLSVVYGIVQTHQGVIDVRSQLGRGTTIEVLLPCITSIVAAGDPRMPDVKPPTQGIRVLFVDDETSITRLVQIMLKTLQHHPTTYDKAPDALAHFRTHADAYDLIITDLTMPGMTGIDFARGIRLIRNDIPIILSSGFPDEITEGTLRDLGIVEVLPKPFQMQALGDAIARHHRR